jgi:hypothetical protein
LPPQSRALEPPGKVASFSSDPQASGAILLKFSCCEFAARKQSLSNFSGLRLFCRLSTSYPDYLTFFHCWWLKGDFRELQRPGGLGSFAIFGLHPPTIYNTKGATLIKGFHGSALIYMLKQSTKYLKPNTF